MADSAFDLDPVDILNAGEPTEPIETEPVESVDGEEPPVEPTEPTEPVDGEEPPTDDEPAEGDDDPKKFGKGDDDVDLRKAAPELRTALNKLRETDPKGAKLLRAALGHDLAYQETFKTPEEARVFKASIEAVGGPEGVAALQEQAAFSQETDALLEANDPQILDRIAEDFPKALPSLTPHILDKLRTTDKEAYNKALLPHLVDSLEASGLGNVLNAAQEALNNGDVEGAKKVVANVLAWMGGKSAEAKNLRTTMTSPEMDKINEERTKLNSEREQMFEKQWREPVGQHASATIYKMGEPYIRAVPVGQQRVFFQEVIKEINNRVTGDKTYMSQENAHIKSKNRDINKIVAFKKAKIDTVVQGAVEKVAKDFGYKPGVKPTAPAPKAGAKPGATKPVTGAGATPQNPIVVKEKPAEADRDKDKMGKGYVDHIIAGRALMKSGPYRGRWVTWRGAKA